MPDATPIPALVADATNRQRHRPAWAEVDLDAIEHNAAVLKQLAAPSELCAVVKADGYGHGAVETARAALAGGATKLAVALVEEGATLADAGITAPILLLSEPPADAFEAAAAAGITPTLYTAGGVERAAAAAERLGRRLPVHLKVDTGMHRVGAAPSELPALARAVADQPMLVLEGVWTHLAVADGVSAEDHDFTRRQLHRYDEVLAHLDLQGLTPSLRHTANSAGAIAWPEARYQMVRCGIALYGELPGPMVEEAFAAAGVPSLRPALSLKARVSAIRDLEAGARPSYGRCRELPMASRVATVPLGYADGVPRHLFEAGYSVLIGGRRRPLAGMVTMDQIVVDCGPDGDVQPHDEVVLMGSQGDETVGAGEWASMLGTISYEVLCGIGVRVPRTYVGRGLPPASAGGPL